MCSGEPFLLLSTSSKSGSTGICPLTEDRRCWLVNFGADHPAFCLLLSTLLSTDETKVYCNLYSVANIPTYPCHPHLCHISSTNLSHMSATFQPHVSHIWATSEPHFSHISATFQPHLGHIWATSEPLLSHILATSQQHISHMSATCQLYVSNISTTS